MISIVDLRYQKGLPSRSLTFWICSFRCSLAPALSFLRSAVSFLCSVLIFLCSRRSSWYYLVRVVLQCCKKRKLVCKTSVLRYSRLGKCCESFKFRAEPKVRPESRGLVFDVLMVEFRAEPKVRPESRGLVFDVRMS